MDISLVIEQLRRYCPELGGRVGGAADFETGVESVIAITDPATGKFVYPAAVMIEPITKRGQGRCLAFS